MKTPPSTIVPGSEHPAHSNTPLSEKIDNDCQAIWHITELLSKVDSPDDDTITLSTGTLHYFSQQISDHLGKVVGHIEGLDVRDR